jgi:hypothetical protein
MSTTSIPSFARYKKAGSNAVFLRGVSAVWSCKGVKVYDQKGT